MLLNLQNRTEWTTGMLQLHKRDGLPDKCHNQWTMEIQSAVTHPLPGLRENPNSELLLEGGLLFLCSCQTLLVEEKKKFSGLNYFFLLLLSFFLFSLSSFFFFFWKITFIFISNKQQLQEGDYYFPLWYDICKRNVWEAKESLWWYMRM